MKALGTTTQIQIKQLGLMSTTINYVGQVNSIDLFLQEERLGTPEQVRVFSSGTITNNHTTTVIVRIDSNEYLGGFADIKLNAKDRYKFKNLHLSHVFLPSIQGQAPFISTTGTTTKTTTLIPLNIKLDVALFSVQAVRLPVDEAIPQYDAKPEIEYIN